LADLETQTIVLLEYFLLKKIQSIPIGICTLQRLKFNNAVAFMTSACTKYRRSIVAIGQQEYLGEIELGY
jgi:hypothetical protein